MLTNKGAQLQEKFNIMLVRAEKELPTILDKDRKKVLEIVNELGGNILLLDCINGEVASKLKTILDKIPGLDLVKEEDTPFGALQFLCFSYLGTMETLDFDFGFFDSSFNFNDSGVGGSDIYLDSMSFDD